MKENKEQEGQATQKQGKIPFMSAMQKIIHYNRQSQQSSLQGDLGRIFEQPDNIINKTCDAVNFGFSSITVVHYIATTYYKYALKNPYYEGFNVILHIYFLFEWILRLFAAKDRLKYLKSTESLVDIISCIPFFVIRIITMDPFYENDNNIYNDFSNLMNLTRIQRFQRLTIYVNNDDVNRQLLDICLSVMTLLMFSGATIQFVERVNFPSQDRSQGLDEDLEIQQEYQNYYFQFHYYIYFVMTAISTVGYENLFQDPTTRIMIIVLLWFAIYFVPTKSSELMQLLSKKSYYSRINYKATESIPHIVITGIVSLTAAHDFFTELFHDDHGSQKKHAIILLPHPPDSQMEALLAQRKSDIIYLQGDPLKEIDLNRCQIDKAKAIVILCNKQSAEPHEQDAQTILQAMHIKKQVKKQLRFCVQLLRQEGKMQYYLSLTKSTKNDQIICIEELKMSLLAKSCLCPGLNTFISNLITSSEESQKKGIEYDWLEDYQHGQGYEIYRTNLTTKFAGMSFSEAALTIYTDFEAVMFGIEIIKNEQSQIYLNPSNLYLTFNKGERIYGYIISEDKKVSDDIANYKLSEYEKQQNLLKKRASIMKKKKNNKQLNQQKHNTSDSKKKGQIADRLQLPQLDQNDINQATMKTNTTKVSHRQSNIPLMHQDRKNTTNIDIYSQNRNSITRQYEMVDLNKVMKDHNQLKQKEFYGEDQYINNEMEYLENGSDEYDYDYDDDDYYDEDEDDEEEEEDENEEDLNVGNKQENFKNILYGEPTKMQETCYITKEKIDLRDVTFKTLKNNILANNHIILCGLCHNLFNFMIPLRSKYIQKYPTIVILNEEPPSEKQWSQIASFPEIYYVQGSALSDRDLQRANIMQAERVVILTPNITELRVSSQQGQNISENEDDDQKQNQPRQLSKEEEDLLDAKTVFKYKAVRRLRPNIDIVTELVNPLNFAFLLSSSKDYALMRDQGYNNTPLFASGEVYLSSVMDSLSCQAYYNNALITVLNLLLLGSGGNISSEVKKQPQKQNNHKNNSQSDSNNQSQKDIQNSNLFHLKVPNYFVGQTFASLFGYLAKRRQYIALGIYRKQISKDNQLPYVMTNPKPATILYKSDMIFVLAQQKPGDEVLDWGGPLELREDQNYLQYNNLQQINRKSNIISNTDLQNTNSQVLNGLQNPNKHLEQEIALKFANINKDSSKKSQNEQEFQLLQERINQISHDMMNVQRETQEVQQTLNQREQKLLEQIREIFYKELSLLAKKNGSQSKIDINSEQEVTDNNVLYDSQNIDENIELNQKIENFIQQQNNE